MSVTTYPINDFDAAVRLLSDGRNVVLYPSDAADTFNYPSIVAKIPRTTIGAACGVTNTTVHPAFVIGSNTYKNIYVSKYPNVVFDGYGLSLPLRNPASGITLEQAYTYSSAMGVNSDQLGWHLMTALESSLLAWLAKTAGTQPSGNTSEAKVTSAGALYAEEPTAGSGGKTVTGSGSRAWSDNNTIYGIDDLCGNVKEHVSGLFVTAGQSLVFVTSSGNFDNSAAIVGNTPYQESYYKYFTGALALQTSDTDSVKIDIALNASVLNLATSISTQGAAASFDIDSITESLETSDLTNLALLGLYPLGAQTGFGGKILFDASVTPTTPASIPVRHLTRGGDYTSGADGGIFCSDFNNTGGVCGFRSVYIDPSDTEE